MAVKPMVQFKENCKFSAIDSFIIKYETFFKFICIPGLVIPLSLNILLGKPSELSELYAQTLVKCRYVVAQCQILWMLHLDFSV